MQKLPDFDSGYYVGVLAALAVISGSEGNNGSTLFREVMASCVGSSPIRLSRLLTVAEPHDVERLRANGYDVPDAAPAANGA